MVNKKTPKTDDLEDFVNFPVSLEIPDELPKVSDMPEKAQQVLTLTAFGFSYRSIGKSMGMKPQSVQDYIDRYDPDRTFAISSEGRRAIMSKIWEARCGEALLAITPEKLEITSAKDLALIAKIGMDAMQQLSVRNDTKQKPHQQLLNALEANDDSPLA